jgi:hypothetical protein
LVFQLSCRLKQNAKTAAKTSAPLQPGMPPLYEWQTRLCRTVLMHDWSACDCRKPWKFPYSGSRDTGASRIVESKTVLLLRRWERAQTVNALPCSKLHFPSWLELSCPCSFF